MIEHVWSVLCRSSAIDQETNSISLFNVLDFLAVCGAPSSPFKLPVDYEVTSLWTRSDPEKPEHGSIRICLHTPDGSEVAFKDNVMELDLDKSVIYRSRLKFPALPLSVEGKYSFSVEYQSAGNKEWIKATSLPIFVKFEPLPDQPKPE